MNIDSWKVVICNILFLLLCMFLQMAPTVEFGISLAFFKVVCTVCMMISIVPLHSTKVCTWYMFLE